MKKTIGKFRVQLMPNVIRSERRICLTRVCWESIKPMCHPPGVPHQASHKLSVSLCWKWQDLWVGAFWQGAKFPEAGDRYTLWICLIPCLPIRIKLIQTFGGIIP